MNERYTKAFPVSWDQLHRDSKALAWRLADRGPWRRIVTVTRGGMVPNLNYGDSILNSPITARGAP